MSKSTYKRLQLSSVYGHSQSLSFDSSLTIDSSLSEVGEREISAAGAELERLLFLPALDRGEAAGDISHSLMTEEDEDT